MLAQKRRSTSVPTLAQWITASFGAEGTTHAFLVPGFLLGPLCEALAESPACRPIVCAHELGAAYAADGYARVSGKPGWCLAISAPGASNMLTGAIAARLDYQRVFYLVGDVPTSNAGRSAFQDGGEPGSRDRALFAQAVPRARASADVCAAARDFRELLAGLFDHPPGPSFLSLPRDVQAMEVATFDLPRLAPVRPAPARPDIVANLLAALRPLRCPALLVGEMAASDALPAALITFAERFRVPVATTMPAKGLFPETHPLALGCFGYGGSPRAREALLGAANDGVLALGVSLNERNTLAWDKRFLTERRVLRVLPWGNGERPTDLDDFLAHPVSALQALSGSLVAWLETIPEREVWLDQLAALPLAAAFARPAGAYGLHPAEIVRCLRATLPEPTRLFVDAGLCRRAVGQWWTSTAPGQIFTSPVTAPMGWGLGASIGGQLADPSRPVVALAGDGSMLMHGTEMLTAVRYGLPVIWVVNNNAALGTVWQRAPTPEAARLTLTPRLDWAAQAELYGAKGYRAATSEELAIALSAAMRARRPAVIDVRGTLDFAPDDPLFGGTTHGQKARD